MSITDPRVTTPAPSDGAVPPHAERVDLLDGRAAARYRQRWGWAITTGGVVASGPDRELALSTYLDVLWARRPLFVELADPRPYARRGLDTYHYADEAVLDLASFDLTSDRAAALRRDVNTARNHLVVLPLQDNDLDAVAALAPVGTLRGDGLETWLAVDTLGLIRGVAVWSTDQDRPDGHGPSRSLRRIAVDPHGPAHTVELLVADAVDEYRATTTCLRLAWRSRAPWWPARRGCGPDRASRPDAVLALARFGARWRSRWLALPASWQLPLAALVLHRAQEY